MRYLLDTSALLAHYRQEAGGDEVQALFEADEAELMIASLTLTENAGLDFQLRGMTISSKVKSMLIVLLCFALASIVLAREPGFGEFRAVQESLSHMPAKFHAEWLQKHGLDASRYTEFHRPESSGLELKGKWGRGVSNEVTGRGNLVALTLGSEVALLNVANPDSPVVLSEIQLSFIPAQSALHDSFLLTGGNGIEVWNIADSTRPVYRNVIPYAVSDFAVFDTFLYFSSGGTFYSYSIANTPNPHQLGTCADTGDVTSATRNVAVVSESSYVMGFIDVSNPTAPKRVGTYPSFALAADARNTICCAEIYWQEGSDDQFRFEVLDISDPANVVRIGAVDSVAGWDVHLSGPLAFASGSQWPQWKFTIVDMLDSVHPRVISSCGTPGGRFGVWADWTSNRAYVADVIGMAVMNISNLNSPVYDTTVMSACVAYDVSLDQGRAYVADDEAGLRILDVSDPAAPVELGGIDTAYYHYTECLSAVGCDSFAFAGWLPYPGLRTIDVTDPTRPTMAGGCWVFNPIKDMVLGESLLYIAEASRFQVVNVARPRQPTLVGSCVLSGEIGDMTMVGDLTYVTSFYFTTIDVSRPDSPKVINEWGSQANGIDVDDTILYMAYEGLKTASIANPTMPYVLDSVFVDDDTRDVVKADSFAVLGGSTVRIYNVADPRDIRLVGTWTPPGLVQKLIYQPPYIYAACGRAGVCVLEIAEPGVQEAVTPSLRRRLVVVPSITAGPVHVVTSGRLRNLTLCDALGKEVMGAAPGPDWPKAGSVTSVNLAGLPAGVYMLRGVIGGQMATAKVVKMLRR